MIKVLAPLAQGLDLPLPIVCGSNWPYFFVFIIIIIFKDIVFIIWKKDKKKRSLCLDHSYDTMATNLFVCL